MRVRDVLLHDLACCGETQQVCFFLIEYICVSLAPPTIDPVIYYAVSVSCNKVQSVITVVQPSMTHQKEHHNVRSDSFSHTHCQDFFQCILLHSGLKQTVHPDRVDLHFTIGLVECTSLQ